MPQADIAPDKIETDAKALHVGLKAPDTLPLASTSSLAKPTQSKALELKGWQKEVAAVAQHSLNNVPEKASVAVLAPVLNVVRILQQIQLVGDPTVGNLTQQAGRGRRV